MSVLEAVELGADSLHAAIEGDDADLLELPTILTPELIDFVRS